MIMSNLLVYAVVAVVVVVVEFARSLWRLKTG